MKIKQKEYQLSDMNIKELENLLVTLDDNDYHLVGRVSDELMIRRAKYRLEMEDLVS